MEFKTSLNEAYMYSSISKKTLIKTFNIDSEIDEDTPSVPLLKLPVNVIHDYFTNHHKGVYLNVDFTSYYFVHGRRKTLKLFEELKYLEYYYYRHIFFWR